MMMAHSVASQLLCSEASYSLKPLAPRLKTNLIRHKLVSGCSFRPSSINHSLSQHKVHTLNTASRHVSIRAQALDAAAISGPTDVNYYDVDEICGIRVVATDDAPIVEYRVKWKDGSPDTWESPDNLADNLVRDFDDRWWSSAKKADEEALRQMLAHGKDVLALVMDENRRSALHFAAGLGKVEAVKLLVAAGADVNLQDKEGFTPLHMAAGYMQTRAMSELLSAGADPTLKDNAGRDISVLVEGLKEKLGANPSQLPRRLALEEVTNKLLDSMYEEVVPRQILEMVTPNVQRNVPKPDCFPTMLVPPPQMREVQGAKQYLVQYGDGHDDEWVQEQDLSEELLTDFQAALEYGEAAEIVDYEQRGMERKFLLRWKDGHPDTWEPEEHVSQALLQQWVEQHPELQKRKKKGPPRKKRVAGSQAGSQAVGSSTNGSNGKGNNGNGAASGGGVGVHSNGSGASTTALSEVKQTAGVA